MSFYCCSDAPFKPFPTRFSLCRPTVILLLLFGVFYCERRFFSSFTIFYFLVHPFPCSLISFPLFPRVYCVLLVSLLITFLTVHLEQHFASFYQLSPAFTSFHQLSPAFTSFHQLSPAFSTHISFTFNLHIFSRGALIVYLLL